MNHLNLLIYFIPLCFGLFSLGLLTLLYLKNKDPLLKYFLIFFTVFTIQTILALLSRYYLYNIHDNPLLLISLRQICPYILIFFGIIIFHEIFEVKFYKYFNVIFIIILTLSFLYELIEDLLLIYKTKSFIINSLDEFVFILVVIYILMIIIIYRKKIKRKEFKSLLKASIIAFSITLLLFIFDSLEEVIKINIPTGSLHYLTWNIFIIHLIIKYYSNIIFNKIEPTENFIKKYNISKREIEIINQLLKGYSYKKICDECFISLSTVKTHVSNIYNKIGINSRHELFSFVQKIN